MSNERVITKVNQIKNEDIKEIYRTSSKSDKKWIRERTEQLRSEYGDDKYYSKLRSEIASKFMPELKAKKSRKKNTLLDMFDEIDKLSN